MISIERARAANAKTIAQLNVFVQKLHAAAYPDIFKQPGDNEATEQFFEPLLDDEKNYFYLAYIAEAPVGYIWAQLEQRGENPLMYGWSRAYIHHVCVDEQHRKKGVGLALMQAVEKLAKEAGIETVALDTWSFNQEAQQFFECQGFEIYNLRMWKAL